MTVEYANRPHGNTWLSDRRRVGRATTGILLWVLAIAFLTPLLWMLTSSVKNNLEVFAVPIKILPAHFRWDNYLTVWTGSKSILPFFVNSTIVAVAKVVGEIFTASLAGYAFAQLAFRGRGRLFVVYLATSLVPQQLLLVPQFIYFQQVGLYDTLWALILPGMFTVLGTFLMRQFFVSMPAELGQAARVDGASEWRTFWSVYLPLARPMIASLAILRFVGTWNDYEGPLVLISSRAHYTLPLGIATFTDEAGTMSGGPAMAAAVSSLVPVVVVFLVLQRRFIAALSRAGIK